jgi:hypothetical protein
MRSKAGSVVNSLTGEDLLITLCENSINITRNSYFEGEGKVSCDRLFNLAQHILHLSGIPEIEMLKFVCNIDDHNLQKQEQMVLKEYLSSFEV